MKKLRNVSITKIKIGRRPTPGQTRNWQDHALAKMTAEYRAAKLRGDHVKAVEISREMTAHSTYGKTP